MYDEKNRAMIEGWLDSGPVGIAAFKAWAINQPIRWDGGLPSKEAAEKKLAKTLKQRARSKSHSDEVLYITKGLVGWEIWGARLHVHHPELPDLR